MDHAAALAATHAAATNEYVDGAIEDAVAPVTARLDEAHQRIIEQDVEVGEATDRAVLAEGELAATKATLGDTGAALASANIERGTLRTNLATVTTERDTARRELADHMGTHTVPAEPVEPYARPTGPGFVSLEQLGLPVSGAALREAIARNLNGDVLTLPKGEYRDRDFSQGNMVYRAHSGLSGVAKSGVGGLIGSGPETLLGITPGSSTKAGLIPAQGTGATVPFYILGFVGDQRGAVRLENFGFAPNEVGHIYGTAQIRSNAAKAVARRITGKGCAKGTHWSPPGETFGLNFWRSADALVEDCDLDGLGDSSSLLGFNDVPTSRVLRTTLRNQPYGMPTWWQCGDIYTEDLVSLGGHSGINHERVYGNVHHVRPTVKPDRAKFPNAMHFGYNTDQAPGTMLIEDAVGDIGLKGDALMFHVDDVYAGVPQKQPLSGLTVKRGGVTLVGYDFGVSGSKPAGDGTKNYFIYR